MHQPIVLPSAAVNFITHNTLRVCRPRVFRSAAINMRVNLETSQLRHPQISVVKE